MYALIIAIIQIKYSNGFKEKRKKRKKVFIKLKQQKKYYLKQLPVC